MTKGFTGRLSGVADDEQLRAAGQTDPGQWRENNEDAFAIMAGRDIYIIADGMGDHNAGEVAAAEAIKFFEDFFTEDLVDRLRREPHAIRDMMQLSFAQVSKRVYGKSQTDASLLGMGCTLVVALLNGSTLHACHAGDARCYVTSASIIEQIGRDHSYVWDLVRLDKLTPEEARTHYMKNIVTQVIGQRSPIESEYETRELRPGERILMCSDGLWDMLPDEEIQAVMSGESLLEPPAAS